MKNESHALIFAILAVLCWSTVATAFKLTLRYLSVGELLFYSTTASILVFFVVLLINGKFKLLWSCTKKQYLKSLLLGFLNPFFYYTILFHAYDLIPAQIAQPVNNSWALTLTLLSVIFLGQQLQQRDILGLCIGYFGIVVISLQFEYKTMGLDEIFGTLIALFSSVIWALYWLLNVKEEHDSVISLCLSFCFAYPLIAVYCFVFETIRIPPLAGIFGAMYVGLFEMSVAFIFWITALKLTNNTARISILVFFSPCISLFFIYLFVGEKISIYSILGLALIILGLIIQRLGKLKIKTESNRAHNADPKSKSKPPQSGKRI